MSGGQFAGVARDANLIDLRALDGTGSGKDSRYRCHSAGDCAEENLQHQV